MRPQLKQKTLKIGGGSAPGNPMLATTNTSANCGGEDTNIKGDTVDAKKNKIGGE